MEVEAQNEPRDTARSRESASYRDAPYPRERRSYRQYNLCNKCKLSGHFARDCPNMTVCHSCELPGHIAAVTPQIRKSG